MPRVIHFEIGADDPQRAADFYQRVFDWDVHKWEGQQPYWLVETGPKSEPGINGGIMNRMGPQSIVNTMDVPSVDEFMAKVTAAGGKVNTPKMVIPGIGWLAYCTDTEGNQFGIMQADPSAK